MAGAEPARAFARGLRQHLLGTVGVLQGQQARANQVEQFDAESRPVGQSIVGARLHQPEKLLRRERVSAGVVGAGVAEERDQEIADLRGLVPLGHRDPRLPRRQASAGQDRHEHERGGADRDGVARHVLGHAVPDGVGPREHRLMAQMTLDVLGECVDGGVALLRPFLERREHDRVEVAAEGTPGRRIGAGVARTPGVDLGDRPLQRAARGRGQRVGSCAGQQLVQQHAARVHVGRDAERFARELFGRCVVRREEARRLPG